MLCSLCYQWPLGPTTSAKVCGPYVVTLLNGIPMFEWYVARLANENGHPIKMCHNDIGLCAQNFDFILGSIVNVTRRIYVIT